ncbi:phosphoribosylformylglycinamidine synthase subunit PurL [Nitrospina watsonii]|uniref:Phosphoribosylformylglycinamidine synthase subunit PurL n=1 Tax=Nitrospina watsonii TaxID=1323948 RepID=A0ABM9HB03_9BACT|nr:phosphoribosylformylglycinamidine synthase subunit PurL [Nitrospina watsonii]CAI2717354.1 Phosphoribosylformylglycinamidine synthase subunit PurL [Nitrospina watsonii]
MSAPPPITAEQVAQHGLTKAEYQRICDLLGRKPNLAELGIFSAMWSEHCSYKSSKPHLKTLPTEGPRVLQGPGENAGVVDIGDGLAAVFKIESHNHPSFIEPYQGAATGVGGILRDIFTMGARPIALLNSLRFGNPDSPKMRYLFNGVVKGIAGYGNCIGVPTVGGDIYFDDCYDGNILVNVFCLGLARADKIFLGNASGVGNAIVYVGSKTGRDGIHGAVMSSAEFDDSTEEKRPTVQVGDPFMEKLLLEACLEIMQKDWVVGVQDMGAAGLTSSAFEMAERADSGVSLDLDAVPVRETGMNAYEIMLSESQERMVFVIESGHEEEALAIFRKWDLDAAVIGRVTDDRHMRIRSHGEEVVALPIEVVVHGATETHRPTRKPKYLETAQHLNLHEIEVLGRGDDALKKLLASPTIASKECVFDQYDHMVGLNTLVLPGSDAAVLRIPDSEKALAISVDCNSRYCYLDPFQGAQIAVAESCRNLVCSGAEPVGVTNCLNFGNPENPEIMWQFEQAVRGLGDFCRFFNIPVVSGNVSLYNETKGEAIFPTPTVAVVGLLEDRSRHMTQWFKQPGHRIGVLGLTLEELGGSEYLKLMFDRCQGKPPVLNPKEEMDVQQLCLGWIRNGLIASAHDCSEGGLAVALAESCFSGPEPLGAAVELETTLRPDAVAFGESQSRIVVSFEESRLEALEAGARQAGVEFQTLGTVGGSGFHVNINGEPYIQQDLDVLAGIWKHSLSHYANRVSR